MQLHELKQQLIKKTIQPIYIFTGQEVAVMGIYIKKIADIMGVEAKRIDKIGDIYSRLQNNSFLNKANCYVIRDDKDYLSQEKVWDNINNGSAQGENVIILIYTNLDKRSKFYKRHALELTEFEKLSPEVLAKYIKKEIGLEPVRAGQLAKMCDQDLSRILLECDKLKQLSLSRYTDIKNAFDQAIEERLIHTEHEEVIFEFIDSICKRDILKSYELLYKLKLSRESPLGPIALLYNNIRQMLLVLSAGQGDISKRTGLTAWQIKCAKEKGKRYSIGELARALRIIRETEKGIKTGFINQEISLDYILSYIF